MAAGATYEPIATTTLGSAQATITFSSIPSTYTDLRVVLTGTSDTGNPGVFVQFNADTATNYSITQISGNGTSASSARTTNGTFWELDIIGLTTTIPKFYTFDLFSYAGSTYKTGLITSSEDSNGSGSILSKVALYRSTSAITSIKLYVDTNNFAAGTTATLYGIKAA